jgi:DNA-binding XRE family transcriptional regulator
LDPVRQEREMPQESKEKKAARKVQRERWAKAVRTVIVATRKDADLNQDQLAELVGWSRSKLANIEAGRRRLQTEDFAMIALALRLEPEALMRRVGKWVSG